MGSITIGFHRLNKQESEKLLNYAEKHKLTAKELPADTATETQAAPSTDKSAKARRSDDGTDSTATLQRRAQRLARAYADKHGADAKKTVLNHFGATGITGKNGLDPEHLVQVNEIFASLEIFQPDGNAGNDPQAWADAAGKKKKKGKGKKKDKGKNKTSKKTASKKTASKKKSKSKKKDK